MTERRWGKAGVRLTPVQIAANNAHGHRRAAEHAEQQATNYEVAHRKWQAGLVVPHSITIALDAHDLYGPEVDLACHAAEPDVDLWEAGKLYPRWDQLLAVAALTQKTPRWFVDMGYPLGVLDTSMRFHLPRYEQISMRRPVVRYPDRVVASCQGTDLWKEWHQRP